MADFSKGDVVKLKSGGPTMTVADTGSYAGGMGTGPEDGVKCVWFDTVRGVQKSNEQVFDAAVLQKIPPASERMGSIRMSRG
ncbi:MAG: YodC family protein [Janthinobacterium lividum]